MHPLRPGGRRTTPALPLETLHGAGASPAHDEWLTADEVAALFKISRKTVYALRQRGLVRAYYPFGGRNLRFRRSEIESAA